MSGEVAIIQYLSMMRVQRHWDHLSHQNSVTFTRCHIQNPSIKSQLFFLNYSMWFILSPSQAFTVGRAVSWCPKAQFVNATWLGFYWVGNRSRETLLEPGTSRSPTCGPPKATGKRYKKSSLTGEKIKKSPSLQVPVSPFITEMWHSKLDSNGTTHIPKPGKPPELLKYEQAFPADFGNFFQCSTLKETLSTSIPVKPLRCVSERSSSAHPPSGCWRSCRFVWPLQDFQHSPKEQLHLLRATTSVHRVHMESRAHASQGAIDGARLAGQSGQIPFNSLKHSFAFLVSGALYNRSSWIIHWMGLHVCIVVFDFPTYRANL